MNNPAEFFAHSQQNYQEQATVATRQHRQWSTLRAAYFILGITGLIWLANERIFSLLGWALLVFIVGFVVLIRVHQRIRYRRDIARLLTDINTEELNRLEGKLRALDPGEEFMDAEHPYTSDLDVFGGNSIFQLLNRTTTPTGRITLAGWLSKAAQPDEIEARQMAAKELAPNADQRQHWQAVGRHHQEKEANLESLGEWLKSDDQISHKGLWKILRWVLPAITIGLYTAYGLGEISFAMASVSVVINIIALGRWFNYSMGVQKQTGDSVGALKSYEALIRDLETYTPTSNKLQTLHGQLVTQGKPASKVLARLKLILDSFDSRANLLYILANLLLVLDIHWLFEAERWRKQHGKSVGKWFDVVGEWEALSSLAALHYAQPQFTFANIVRDGYNYQAKTLGHPLIPSQKRVSNDFAMEGKGTSIVITGSNMAGKSTFLRTVGVNAVLAYAGAPSCAEDISLSVMQVFTSMRTQDNLEESISSFYAELRRLRQLLERLDAQPEPVLFLLDEILKGTNSLDRHRGATGLIRQLNQLHAMGLVSTHDVSLGDLQGDLAGLQNFSFNSRIEDDEIIFDYRLTPGVCKEFNAAALMAKMGIRVENPA